MHSHRKELVMFELVPLAELAAAHYRETLAHSALPGAPVRPEKPRRRRLRRMIRRPRT
jgi:hypothetical protein